MTIGQFLLAPNLFSYLNEVLHPQTPEPPGMRSLPPGILGATATGGGFRATPVVDTYDELILIGISMEALLWAFLGGWAARYFASGPDGVLASRVAPVAKGPEPPEAVRRETPRAGGSSPAV